jgi:3-hydroxybutyryl-CoA dehydratase
VRLDRVSTSGQITMEAGQEFNFDFRVDEKVHGGFIKVFDDRNLLHVDDDYARSKGFSSKVMHGNILNGFLSRFVGELLPVKNTIIHSIGITYRKPCYLDDLLSLRATIEEVHESVGVYLFKFSFSARDQVVALGNLQIGLLA